MIHSLETLDAIFIIGCMAYAALLGFFVGLIAADCQEEYPDA